MTVTVFCRALGMGLGATVLMDFWNLFRKRAFGIGALNYCHLGRWKLAGQRRYSHSPSTRHQASSMRGDSGR